MSNVANNDSNNGGDHVGKPEKIVVFDDEIRQYSKKNIVYKGNTDADEEITDCVAAGGDVFFGGRFCLVFLR